MERHSLPTVTGLSIDTHCQMLAEHMREKNTHVMEGFKLFVQMYSAIIAGAVTLRLQYRDADVERFALAADLLVSLVTLATAVVIVDNLRSWYGFRQRLSDVAGTTAEGELVIARPRLASVAKVHFVMLGVMVAAMAAFFLFNPLLS